MKLKEKKLILEKKINFYHDYDANILNPISRDESRKKIGLSANKINGIDLWTSYEISWLRPNGIPDNGILYTSYPSSSPFFIESKSFKFYLNSLHNIKSTKKDLINLIKKDLEDCLQTKVKINMLSKPIEYDLYKGYVDIDNKKIKDVGRKVDSSLLSLSINSPIRDYKIKCSLFRSLCPVTSQPDWATILINYKGSLIKTDSILSYLISYRNHPGFHEECVELIYKDILDTCKPINLSVEARFLRRGGIEINPFRTSEKNISYFPLRDIRQ